MGKSVKWLCVMFVLVLPTIISAQIWVARYDGPSNGEDRANAIAIDNAGYIYVTGYSSDSGTFHDYATVKYDASGVEQWVARYNGPDSGYDRATAIALDNTGNVCVTGRSFSSGTDYDYATVQYDAAGVEQWVARYNGPGNDSDYAFAVVIDNVGNVYVTGVSTGSGSLTDYATVKYDAAGVEQWVARYNGPGNWTDRANDIAVDNAGNIYVTGGSYASTWEEDYATVKYDSAGVEQWVTRYHLYLGDEAVAVVVDNACNVYVTGHSSGPGTSWDYATVKYDSAGVEQWVTRYNGPGNWYDRAAALAVDDAGNVYVTGYSDDSGTGRDYATAKYDSLGVEQWVARYNGLGNNIDAANAIALDSTGNVYVTGRSDGSGFNYDYATVKYDAAGVEQWVARYNGPGDDYDEAYAIGVDDVGNICVTGRSKGSGSLTDYATIKYSPTGVEESKLIVKKGNEITATIFSGPLQLPEGKKCRVFDITGRVVEPTKITRGIYFIEIDGKITQKVVKVR
jgi:hypothetical protein